MDKELEAGGQYGGGARMVEWSCGKQKGLMSGSCRGAEGEAGAGRVRYCRKRSL